MPSPILHTAVGLSMPLCLHPRGRPRTQTISLFTYSAIVSSLPDLDYLPGLAIGQLNAFHQGPSHSLVAVSAAALVLSAIPPLRRFLCIPSPARFFAFTWSLLLLHLLLDIFTADFRPPIGIPLLWPFSSTPVHASFSPFLFPAWSKMALSDLLSPSNLRPILAETLSSLLLLVPSFLHSRHLPSSP